MAIKTKSQRISDFSKVTRFELRIRKIRKIYTMDKYFDPERVPDPTT